MQSREERRKIVGRSLWEKPFGWKGLLMELVNASFEPVDSAHRMLPL